MKRSSDSIDRLSVKQITLESKHGSVRLSIGNDGKTYRRAFVGCTYHCG